MPLATFAAIAVATFATSFISGILGMAGGMILMGILIALLPLPAAMLLHGITQLAANGWRAWMLRHAVDRRVVRGYVAGSLAALALFVVVQAVASKAAALVALGLMPFVSFVLPERLRLNVERRGHSTACGFICTGIALVAGVSGPILDVFFIRSSMGRHAVVASKATTQSFTHLVKIAYFGVVLGATGGHPDPAVAAIMVLLAFAGTNASRRVLERIDDRRFRAWTRWTMAGVGAAYLATGAAQLLGY
jgi:uncharacterized membrane protein YfcA